MRKETFVITLDTEYLAHEAIIILKGTPSEKKALIKQATDKILFKLIQEFKLEAYLDDEKKTDKKLK